MRTLTPPPVGRSPLAEDALGDGRVYQPPATDRLTTVQAAPVVNLKPNTLRGYRRSGPRFTRVDGRVFYTMADLLEWQAHRSIGGGEGVGAETELPWEALAALADQLDIILGRRSAGVERY